MSSPDPLLAHLGRGKLSEAQWRELLGMPGNDALRALLLGRALRAQLAWDCAEDRPLKEYGMGVRMTLCNYAQWCRDVALSIAGEFVPQPIGLDVLIDGAVVALELGAVEELIDEILAVARARQRGASYEDD